MTDNADHFSFPLDRVSFAKEYRWPGVLLARGFSSLEFLFFRYAAVIKYMEAIPSLETRHNKNERKSYGSSRSFNNVLLHQLIYVCCYTRGVYDERNVTHVSNGVSS